MAAARIGVAIGDSILDLPALAELGFLSRLDPSAIALLGAPDLNALMGAGRQTASNIRRLLIDLLDAGSAEGARAARQRNRLLIPMDSAQLHVPARIGDYSDFYASIDHATNVGSMFRPDNPLLPNYKYVPIGYHGRASSIVASGSAIPRPSGQTRRDQAAPPVFGPSGRLDYEVEIGAFIGPGNDLGSSIAIETAEEHLFGLCLVNDWSARDIQTWEYQPLGPFLAKSFATTVGAWVVTIDALEPLRRPAYNPPAGDPEPMP
jgi:fumarylacetoacetase